MTNQNKIDKLEDELNELVIILNDTENSIQIIEDKIEELESEVGE